ncbi:MAG: hypothetical protein CMB57_03365 [Euryarchaeota archaeon]|nr:hypothetical protein [Euryarchaeota archaeon]
MAHVAMVVTNSCAPDPRVERHASWLAELGHKVEIHAWDREFEHPEIERKSSYKIIRYRIGKKPTNNSVKTWIRKKKFISNLSIESDLLILNDTDSMGVKFQGKTVLDIHDMAFTWPLMRGRSALHKLASNRMLKQAEDAVAHADEIIVAAPNFRDWVSKFGKSATCVMNRRDSQSNMKSNDKKVGFFGRIREYESISHLIYAAKIAGFGVVLAGDGLAVKRLIHDFPNLDYRGKFVESDLCDLMQDISVMYAMYDDSRANIQLGAIPTKMLDAAAFGIPSITNSGTPMGDLCLNEKIGTVAPYGDTEKIAEAILEAYQMEVEPKPSNDKHEFQNVIERLIV